MIVATLFQYFAARMDLETVEPAFVDIDIRTELSVIGIEHSGACALGAIQLGMCASQCIRMLWRTSKPRARGSYKIELLRLSLLARGVTPASNSAQQARGRRQFRAWALRSVLSARMGIEAEFTFFPKVNYKA